MSNKTNVLGLCLGASTLSMVHLEKEEKPDAKEAEAQPHIRVVNSTLYPHEGNPRKALLSALEQQRLADFDKIVATGRKFCRFLNLTSISEPLAVECAYWFVKPESTACPAVVTAGGETFMVYVLDKAGQIADVITGNKCASGTGEFFMQQLGRMDVTLEEAADWAAVEDVYHVSGRCSVFCKSDCTHATNKGVPKPNVVAGLCKMMADKILELLKKIERRNIMVVGGTTRNDMMMSYLEREIDNLIVPPQAPCFEALGAALWAFDNDTRPFPGLSDLFLSEKASFESLPPLDQFHDKVEFKTQDRGKPVPGDKCILGLDVGSTTTKAVLMRVSDKAVLCSVYLRTSGDPVGASVSCYNAILKQLKEEIDPADIHIAGLGVCGSGRQIAGLHALTDGIINEIIAHAAAAVFFDPGVDTIFEIGGQDAKYTYITNAVPSDYAMNEACSAGTGSFLEESAKETLGIGMEEIADVALKGKNPPNFNDQCAAFISSDIKNAIHEGVSQTDIVAGLVYSICMNYANRVKANRPVGEKIFMQGGVCYNGAVPLAMASLVGKPIIVPPDPGLAGAFGVALEVSHRIASGIMAEKTFDLETLAGRKVAYRKGFVCGGGKEKCDRGCAIAVIEIEGKKYPFGGACNRYYNLRRNVTYDASAFDMVRYRKKLVFDGAAASSESGSSRNVRGRVGINRSFLVNTYYPLYTTFFQSLGFEVVLPDHAARQGIDQRNSSFCFPGDLAHGFFYNLLESRGDLDYIFLPHFRSVPKIDERDSHESQVCPLVQGETFYLRATFDRFLEKHRRNGTRILTPLIDLKEGIDKASDPLVKTALEMGVKKRKAQSAFAEALAAQQQCFAKMKEAGRKILQEIEADPERLGIVILSRPYNGLVDEAHMGIPHKFASRGIYVIPFDFLDYEGEFSKRHMYWGMGKYILRTARFIEQHPQLFGTYITNFSCGPDSFIISYFRKIMGRKPSLTLELDSHTADAGLETRIEAFIDIVNAYRQLRTKGQIARENETYTPARLYLNNNTLTFQSSSGEKIGLPDPRVKVLLPSMGEINSQAVAAILNGMGFDAVAHKPADESVLKLGRANTSCKECLPLILTTGTLLNYIQHEKKPDAPLVYFFGTGDGPCRFGQYAVFMEDLLERLQIPDVAILTLSSENAYVGMGKKFEEKAWSALVVADVMEDIRSMLLANAREREKAVSVFFSEWQKILDVLGKGDFKDLENQLRETAAVLRRIALIRPPEAVPVITLTGEIFVRRDHLSTQYLTEHLAEKGFATACAPIAEWVKYCDYMMENGINRSGKGLLDKFKLKLRKTFQNRFEKSIKSILSASGLINASLLDISEVIDNGSAHVSVNLAGEAILTVGGAMTDIVSHSCGVIAIGPFGCMPNRLSESILTETMNTANKLKHEPDNRRLKSILNDIDTLPFLAIESDGSAFPQLIHSKLETFCLRAERLHNRIMAERRQASAV